MNTATSTLITSTALAQSLDPTFALAIAAQESGGNQYTSSGSLVTGTSGEIGIFQLKPGTAAGLGVDPTDTAENIQGGVAYLNQMLTQFGGNTAQAAAAYNCGPGCVSNAIATYGDDWLAHVPASTQQYVANVTGTTAAGSSASGDGTDGVSLGDSSLADLSDLSAVPSLNAPSLDWTPFLWVAGGGLALLMLARAV